MNKAPTVREQDVYLGGLGIDPFVTLVERFEVTNGQGEFWTLMYHYEIDGKAWLAVHWPDNDVNHDYL